MTSSYDDARAALASWRDELPADPYAADWALRALIDTSVPDVARREELTARASAFGRAVIGTIAPAATRYEQCGHTPGLAKYDGIGRRVERVNFDGTYHDAGAAVWASGLVADSGTPGRAFEQAVLLYLLSLEGEAGHACPAVCTIGLARALRRRADDATQAQFLAPLLERDYARTQRGSQFLTEVQGGSDVGANACTAEPVGDGSYRISGEKWFCSVADADQFLVTARPVGAAAGTRGLGCFTIPRRLDGAPNGFSLRRLKDKLGTRGLASGEIDFDRALAWPIGPVDEGFKTAVGIVLNTSRWLTAVGATGMMRRAVLEATAYARHRRAFGQPIAEFPLVQRTLASMTAEWLAALHLSWVLTELEDAIDGGDADEETVLYHRFCVNVVKYATSITATRVVRDGIEILGGNGTIEDFSVLPRLYRDAIVYESWEGTHNVIAQQVLNDCSRLPLLDVVADRIERAGVAAVAEPAKQAVLDAHRALDDPAWGAWNFRSVLDRLARVIACTSLLSRGAGTPAEAAGELLLHGPDDEPDLAASCAAILAPPS